MTQNKLCFISLGGTIASVDGGGGAVPSLTAEDLKAHLTLDHALGAIECISFRSVPGPHLTLDDVIALSRIIVEKAQIGIDGFVISSGTDTIEELAFGLDLLIKTPAPIIVVGAMRPANHDDSDGPRNLRAAFRVVREDRAGGCGVLVVMNEEIHGAQFVIKAHTNAFGTFQSRGAGQIGAVNEKEVRWHAMPLPQPAKFSIDALAETQPVALLKLAMGDDGRLLPGLPDLGFKGLVLEAFGGGHTPSSLVQPLEKLVNVMPVVLASRVFDGPILAHTYGFEGSEQDLLSRGLIRAGYLNGVQSRLLLELHLRSGAGQKDICAAFDAYC